ncbi:MAG: hypothetical protein ACRD3N_00440, partial [Terracidiphilus sp.]
MLVEERIRKKARLAVSKFRPISGLGERFGYNRASVEWVDGFIERGREGSKIESGLVQVLGSYLGECIIHVYGGSWREHEGNWGVFFDNSNAVFPFSKVQKQIESGRASGDS